MIRRLLGARHDLDLVGYAPLDAGEHLVGFARLDGSGEPALVTIVPRVVERPPGLTVDLPPGTWRHVLVDDEPDAVGALDIDTALGAFPVVVLRRR